MLDNLEPTVRTAIMKVLAAIYESGIIREVNMGVVMQLFGVPEGEQGPTEDLWISLNDKEFIEEYIKLKDAEREIREDNDFKEALKEIDDMTAELDEYDVEMVDMETGESTHTTMTREELDELDVDNPEDLPGKTKRVLH